jgi:hypothetical protein
VKYFPNNRAGASGTNANVSGVSSTPFFSDPGVRRQLNMNNTQFNSLNRAYQNAYNRYNQATRNLAPNLNEAQRAQQLQQLQSQFNSDLAGTVNGTFTNPQTLNRYNQLNRQFMGFNAFNDPQVRQQLNLSADQMRQLRTLNNNWRQQLQQFRRGAGNDLSNVNQQQWSQMWQQYATQLNGVLTPDQQQTWAQLVGQPYTFSPNVMFGAPGTAGNFQQMAPQPTDASSGTTGTTRFFPNTPGGAPNAAGGSTNPASGVTTQGTEQPTGTQATRQITPQGTTTEGTQSR